MDGHPRTGRPVPDRTPLTGRLPATTRKTTRSRQSHEMSEGGLYALVARLAATYGRRMGGDKRLLERRRLALETMRRHALDAAARIDVVIGVAEDVEAQVAEVNLDEAAALAVQSRRLVAELSIIQTTLSLVTRVETPTKEWVCLLYTSPSPRDRYISRMPSSA